jgi:hypothetical protein
VSLRLADPPARIREGSWLDLDVVFSNHSAKTVYLPSRTMVSSPSFLFQKLGRGGRRSGEPIYDPGWCQGVLMGGNAVEIAPGGRHRCHLEQDTEMPAAVTGGSAYRVKVSLRYHIHAPTVIG